MNAPEANETAPKDDAELASQEARDGDEGAQAEHSVLDDIVLGIKKFLMSDSPSRQQPRLESGDAAAAAFDALFPQLVADMTESGGGGGGDDAQPAMDWFRRVSEYNVPHGKKNRGLMVVEAVRLLMPGAGEDVLQRARVLGWCIEWLQASFLVADDVMDKSETRRGQPCWYKVDKVGLEAINDGMFLESAIYILLKKYFRHTPYYVDLLELFHQMTHKTIIGQCLDMTTSPGPGAAVDFSRFSLERYSSIVKYKTGYYSFCLPVACAMFMSGISDAAAHERAGVILLKMGEFFQVQDDYLDCYGSPAVIGKVGRDIEDNKCSWLVVQALDRVSQEQRRILQENYGQEEPEKVAAVKALYNSLKLPAVYAEYEEESYQKLMALINQQCPQQLPKEIFITFANKIYKRKK